MQHNETIFHQSTPSHPGVAAFSFFAASSLYCDDLSSLFFFFCWFYLMPLEGWKGFDFFFHNALQQHIPQNMQCAWSSFSFVVCFALFWHILLIFWVHRSWCVSRQKRTPVAILFSGCLVYFHLFYVIFFYFYLFMNVYMS